MTMRAGLGDPVLDAQGIFRSVLDAMAHPGRVVTVPSALEPPAPLDPATAAVCLTLLDFETPLWLDPAARTPEVLDYLRFHCGVPVCESRAEAAFSVVADALRLPPLGSFQAGSDEYPDRSTTVIVQVGGVMEGIGRRLTGPGIDGERWLALEGVSGRIWGMLRENQGLFPRGIDVLVTAGSRLVGLPRTTRLGD
jgi:alpha-D-ribose 1-methylphosphonate 5-triphosphate synthase subunit PhnH